MYVVKVVKFRWSFLTQKFRCCHTHSHSYFFCYQHGALVRAPESQFASRHRSGWLDCWFLSYVEFVANLSSTRVTTSSSDRCFPFESPPKCVASPRRTAEVAIAASFGTFRAWARDVVPWSVEKATTFACWALTGSKCRCSPVMCPVHNNHCLLQTNYELKLS